MSLNQQLLEDNTQFYICLKIFLCHTHSAMWGYNEKSAVCSPKWGPSTDPDHTGTLILDFQLLELWEIDVSCFQAVQSIVISCSSLNRLSQHLIPLSTEWMMEIQDEGRWIGCSFWELSDWLREESQYWPGLQWNFFLLMALLWFSIEVPFLCNLLLGWYTTPSMPAIQWQKRARVWYQQDWFSCQGVH